MGMLSDSDSEKNIDYHYIVAVGIFMVQVGEF
jgi:hypothetical protein